MSLLSKDQTRMETQVQARKAAGQAVAMATVVRTLAATSAKPGELSRASYPITPGPPRATSEAKA